jgi:isopenicillin N synthase-like dioxygenase
MENVQTPEFPILDYSRISTDFSSFAEEIFAASKTWGFFILTDTGIKGLDRMSDLVRASDAPCDNDGYTDGFLFQSREFFSLPLEQKAEKILNDQTIGYDGNVKTT